MSSPSSFFDTLTSFSPQAGWVASACGGLAIAYLFLGYSRNLKFWESKKYPSRSVIENPESVKEVVAELKANFAEKCTNKTKDGGRWDFEWRRSNLVGLYRFIVENSKEIGEAGKRDLNKGESEWFLEKQAVLGDIKLILNNLERWMKPESRATPLWMWPSNSYVVREPYGVSVVFGAWNYPITLCILPLAGAICAGNACIVKPSELAPALAKLMAEKLPYYVDPEAVRIILGGPATASLVLEADIDFVFFTGSTQTGAIVGTSCAKRLIPCALELGGKSPTIVDGECDLKVTARRITQAKFVNAGQTCVAPDYLLVVGDESYKLKVVEVLKLEIACQFGNSSKEIQANPNFARIVNDTHFKRVTTLMKGVKVVCGGNTDAKDKYIEPTLVLPETDQSAIMQEEIFGPVLPVISVPTLDAAIEYIRARPKPLSLYIYSSNGKNVDRTLSRTTSGSACVNESVFQYVNPHLPFGGTGASGSGSYHGHASFLEFSHSKSVLARGTVTDVPFRYLPLLARPEVLSAFGVAMQM